MYTIHEVADLFPMMSTDEFTALVEDIQTNGQQEPITIYQNQIIDGRNRYAACQQLGIEPNVKKWDGQGSLVSFVVSMNLKRRHLTSVQRAAVAAEMLPLLEKEAKERQLSSLKQNSTVREKIPERESGKASEQVAKLTGTNPHYVTDAKKIKKEAPEVFDIREGAITIEH